MCPFCSPVADEVVFRTPETIALVDARPMMAGHVLIAPIAHLPTMREAPNEIQEEVAATATTLMRVLEATVGIAGCYEHGGRVLCRPHLRRVEAPHAHLHLLPIREDLIAGFSDAALDAPRDGDYLSQRLGSTDITTTVPIPAPRLVPHVVRTLAAQALNDVDEPWLPLGAEPYAHAAARRETRDLIRHGLRLAEQGRTPERTSP